jgi:hypothetical protein
LNIKMKKVLKRGNFTMKQLSQNVELNIKRERSLNQEKLEGLTLYSVVIGDIPLCSIISG